MTDASEERAESELDFNIGGGTQTQLDFIRAVMGDDEDEDSEDVSSPYNDDDDEDGQGEDEDEDDNDMSHLAAGTAETVARPLFSMHILAGFNLDNFADFYGSLPRAVDESFGNCWLP